jgi:TolA-binding protein
MKTISKGATLIIAIFLFSYCTSQSGKDLKEITANEKKLSTNRQDAKVAATLDESYKTYMLRYPKDTNIPRMLFEDAQLNVYPLSKTDVALKQLEELYKNHPESRYAPNALFKAAYLNEKAKRYEIAKGQYQLFVKTYPNHDLAPQAKELAEMTGLSEEEQFKQIMAKRNSIQDSVKNQKKVQK